MFAILSAGMYDTAFYSMRFRGSLKKGEGDLIVHRRDKLMRVHN
jgi:hypothetical protein